MRNLIFDALFAKKPIPMTVWCVYPNCPHQFHLKKDKYLWNFFTAEHNYNHIFLCILHLTLFNCRVKTIYT